MLSLIRAMDRAWLDAVAGKRAERAAKPEGPPVSERPMSPALFDALFGG